jgi:RNA polymerase sigma factor (sigma-70 family)
MTLKEYNKCVDEHADHVYRFILKNLRDRDSSKDVVQEAFEKLWINVDKISFDKSKSWLFSTAYHAMIDFIRRQKKITDIENIDPHDYLYRSDYNNASEIIDEAVRRLPEAQRSVIVLRDFEDYSYQEISDITGLSETQVKVYIYRARVFLKDYIRSINLVI